MRQMDAVPQQRLRPQQMIALVDPQIVRQVRKQLAGEFDLGEVLVDMRLDVEVGIFARQRLGHLHLLEASR